VFSKGMGEVDKQSFQKDIFKYFTAALVKAFFTEVNSP
jgi:hypothetical protein